MGTRVRTLISAVVSAAFVVAAVPAMAVKKIGNFDDYVKAPLEKTQFPPTRDQLKEKRKQVAITPVEVAMKSSADSAEVLTELMHAQLSELVQEAAILKDRAASTKVLSELKRREQDGMSTGRINRSGADVAVWARIQAVNTSFTFKPAHEAKNLITRDKTQVPDQCEIKISFPTTIKIVDLAANRTAAIINETGAAEVLVTSRSCEAVTNMSSANVSEAFSSGITEVVKAVAAPLLAELAPTGYVFEKRVLKKGTLFKIDVGATFSAANVKDVAIYNTSESLNELTDEVDKETTKVAIGKMTDQIHDNYSWVFVQDPKKAARVKLGDSVRLVYKNRGGFKLNLDAFNFRN